MSPLRESHTERIDRLSSWQDQFQEDEKKVRAGLLQKASSEAEDQSRRQTP
jgi:hypothetical protein